MGEGILELAQELAEVSRLVEDDDVPTTLGRFVHRVVLTVPDCEEAVITVLADDSAEIVARYHKTADPVAEPTRSTLAEQLTKGGGPLFDALTYGEPRRIGDLAADHRWPEFSAAAINAGYRSCLFLPLPASGDAAAAFSLFSAKPDAFGSTSYDIVLMFAMHAGVAFDNVQLFNDSRTLIEQLRTALGTRTVIGQAQGVLMHRYGVTASVAFDVLKRCSQDTNVKLRQLSLELVEAHNQGRLNEALRKYGLNSGE
ncbi:ANTAR domain-containing protein [Kribbella sp. NBC_00889]|uniref:GAF and ANTAR domain-containing protein n=1 Tax=Kribbella sp. NBC_00889 TaxID=2975974 RepID=UPI003864CDAF|nr:GAF and ANTAR domain-containing protein [Kribbella sp. NBC_00889]